MSQDMIATGLECVSDCLKGKEDAPTKTTVRKPRQPKTVPVEPVPEVVVTAPRKRKASLEEPSQPPPKKPRQQKKPVEKVDPPTIEDIYEMVKQSQSVLTQFMDDVNRQLEEIKSIQALRSKHGF